MVLGQVLEDLDAHWQLDLKDLLKRAADGTKLLNSCTIQHLYRYQTSEKVLRG